MIKAALFTRDGKHFLVPGYWYDADNPGEYSCGQAIDAMMFAIVVGAKVKWVEIATDTEGRANITHQPQKLVGRQFLHGACDILLLIKPEEILSTAEVVDAEHN